MTEFISLSFGIVTFLCFIYSIIYELIVCLIRPIIAWKRVKIGDVYIKKGKKNKDPFKEQYEDDTYYLIKDIKNGYILFSEERKTFNKSYEYSYHWYPFFSYICNVGSKKVKRLID